MVRKGLGRGKGKGYRNIQGRDPKIHSDSARGIKQPQKIPHIPKPNPKLPIQSRDFQIDEHNWGFDIEKGKMKLRLGNWTDAGWHWSGDESDLNSYLIRMSKSEVKDDFIKRMKEKGARFQDFKKQLKKSIDTGNGLYQISGDNAVWHFGEDFVDKAEEINQFLESQDDIELTDELNEKFVNDFDYPDTADFDSFEEEYEKGFKNEMKEFADESNSFEDYFNKITNEDYKLGWQEALFEFQNGIFSEALYTQWNKFKKEELDIK